MGGVEGVRREVGRVGVFPTGFAMILANEGMRGRVEWERRNCGGRTDYSFVPSWLGERWGGLGVVMLVMALRGGLFQSVVGSLPGVH